MIINGVKITAEEKDIFLARRGLSFYLEQKRRDFSLRAWRRNRYRNKGIAHAKLIKEILRSRRLKIKWSEENRNNRINFEELEIVEGFSFDIGKQRKPNQMLASTRPVINSFFYVDSLLFLLDIS